MQCGKRNMQNQSNLLTRHNASSRSNKNCNWTRISKISVQSVSEPLLQSIIEHRKGKKKGRHNNNLLCATFQMHDECTQIKQNKMTGNIARKNKRTKKS